MGSYDRQPEDWDLYADCAWDPPHVIACNSRWSHRPERHGHATVAGVRECFRAARDEKDGAEVWPCSWLLEGRYDDGSTYAYECGAPSRATDAEGSWACSRGHSHSPAWVREREGWDYAEDETEAGRLRKMGIDAIGMDGGSI